MVGRGVSQMRSRTLGCATPLFKHFRNPKDARDFLTAGAAAGVASAFGAPVGGLLFALEEVASTWSQTLTWQVHALAAAALFVWEGMRACLAWTGLWAVARVVLTFSDGRACIDISARVILYIPSSSFVYVFQVNVRNVGR